MGAAVGAYISAAAPYDRGSAGVVVLSSGVVVGAIVGAEVSRMVGAGDSSLNSGGSVWTGSDVTGLAVGAGVAMGSVGWGVAGDSGSSLG